MGIASESKNRGNSKLPPKSASVGSKKAARAASKKSAKAPSDLELFAAKKRIKLNDDQKRLCAELTKFLKSTTKRCFLLKGSAGTGKTFLIKLIAEYIEAKTQSQVALMAPTGRAALVLKRATGREAGTIHRLIYQMTGLTEERSKTRAAKRSPVFYYPLDEIASSNQKSVFIVDESSMISDKYNKPEFFRWGSGRLLKDLVEYAKLRDERAKTKIIFVGDPCQLPPPNDSSSNALEAKYLKDGVYTPVNSIPAKPKFTDTYKVDCMEYELTEVERQKKGDILETATKLREVIHSGKPNYFEIVTTRGDIVTVTADELSKRAASSFKKDPSDGIVVTYTNNEAFQQNASIRKILWRGKRHLVAGDRLLAFQTAGRLINGELILVQKVSDLDAHSIKVPTLTGIGETLHFREISFIREDFHDAKPKVFRTLILENFLNSPERDLSPDAFSAIYEDFSARFSARFPGIDVGHNFKPPEFVYELVRDPYVNCAKVKYGYAMTCHKAQGGQWDQAGVLNQREEKSMHFLRWAYTAITRARKELCVVGFRPHSPIHRLAPGYTMTIPDDKDFKLSISRKFLESFLQEIMSDAGIGMTVESISGFSYKYKFTKDGVSCIVVFSETKDGFIEKFHYEKSDPKLKGIVTALIRRYASVKMSKAPVGKRKPLSSRGIKKNIP